jgi:ribosomal protein S18 acetylase RimI-like enzyme
MRVETHAHSADFAATAFPTLLADEANHTFLLNRLARGDQDPERGPWWSAAVFANEALLACAARDRQAVFLSTGPSNAWPALADILRNCEWLEHVIGDRFAAHAVVGALGRRWRVHVELPLLRLEGSPDAGDGTPRGRMRPAQATDDGLVIEWSLAFHDEAGMADPREHVPQHMRRRRGAGELFVWEDAELGPVAFAGGFLIPPGGARIAPVYTPPPLRGRGYARALVAGLCRELQSRGARSVYLFTDARNPTSNALYRSIGFAPCGYHVHLTIARTA